MKSILFCAVFALLTIGCKTAINTQDVTRVVVTTTGVRVGQSAVDKTPELNIGRHQVEYFKSPSTASNVVSRYEANTHSPIFGNASMTSTLAVGDDGVKTAIGGAAPPINSGTGTGSNLQTMLPK